MAERPPIHTDLRIEETRGPQKGPRVFNSPIDSHKESVVLTKPPRDGTHDGEIYHGDTDKDRFWKGEVLMRYVYRWEVRHWGSKWVIERYEPVPDEE